MVIENHHSFFFVTSYNMWNFIRQSNWLKIEKMVFFKKSAPGQSSEAQKLVDFETMTVK